MKDLPLKGKKILIIVENLPVPFDRRVWLEATTLKKYGATVSVISPKGKKKYREKEIVIDGINIFRYRAYEATGGIIPFFIEFLYCFFMTFILTWKVFFKVGFDAIHACNPPETFFVIGLFFKIFGKKFLFDHHDLSPEMYLAKYDKKPSEGGILYKLLLLFEKLTFKTADVVITTNNSHKEVAIKRGGVDEGKIFVVRSGPDTNRFKIYEPIEELKRGKKFMVCYLGEMCKQDGVDYLIDAVKIIEEKDKRDDIFFVMIGGGPEQPAMVQYAKEKGIKNIYFTGRISDDELSKYLSTCDVCVDPDPKNLWSDKSTMNKIMEYMYFKKPIVAFDLKENSFSAKDAALYAKNNSIDEMARLILKLIDDRKLREKMGKYGRERFEKYLSWEHSIPNLIAAYKRLFSMD